MTSPAHDATALAAALALFPVTGDPTGLMVAAVLIGVQGVAHAHATRKQERAQRPLKRRLAELKERGAPEGELDRVREAIAAVRWDGPRKALTRPIRLAAVLLASMSCLPAAVALACARLPDQLEVGPIDHRKLTHYLVTAAAVVYGAWYGSSELWPLDAERITRGVATGYLMHLLMDGFTRDGVPFFWPLLRRPIHLLPEHPPAWLRLPRRLAEAKLRIKTGGRLDTAVMLGCVGVVLWTAAPG